MTEQGIAQQADAAVGARIMALSWAKRVTQRQIAAALGVAQGGVSRRLRGQTPLTVGELFVVAQLLDVDVVDLVNETGPQTLSVRVPADGVASVTGWLCPVIDLATRTRRAA